MSKRIFTKTFEGMQIVAGGVETEENGVQSWLAQDDIEVLGVSGHALCTQPDENDGFSYLVAELSQTGVLGQDGAILKVLAQEGWNTVPQGIHAVAGHVTIAFPAGATIPVKEEGHLYINLRFNNKSAGMSVFRYGFIVYYTKKGYR